MSFLLSRPTSLSTSVGDPVPSVDTPGTTQAAIACLVIFSIITCVRVSWYLARATPVQGSRMQAARNFSAGYHRTMPVLVALIALLLKLVALGIDTWAVQSHNGITVKLGVLEAHGQGRSQSWANLCDMGFLDSVSCNTVRAGGILTMLAGITSLSCGVVYALLALKATRSPVALSALAPRLYRVSGLAHSFTTGMFLFWLLGAWLILDDQLSWISFGASWWVCLAAMILDGIVHNTARQALLGTLPPEQVGQVGAEYAGNYQPPIAYAVPVQQGGYAPPPQQQAQYQPLAYAGQPQQFAQAPVAYGQPAYAQAPAGYGAPPAGYGQAPPAFNPNAYGQ